MRSTALVLVVLLASPAGASDCPVGGVAISPHLERERIQRTLSTNAELVASSSSSRRRSVGTPSLTPLPVANFIDTHIGTKMTRDKVAPTVKSGDEEFLRRIYLDLTGNIPPATEVQSFVADTAADKRAKKIDALLKSDAFVDRWTMWFGDLVQNVQISTNSREYYLGRNVYYTWIKDSLRAGKPYDAMVRELLAGEGDNFTTGVANYVVRQLQRNGPPQDTLDNLATHSAEKFLGMPVLCVSCHGGFAHLELVNWYLRGKTREDFWKMAAFFSRTTLRGSPYTDPNNPNIQGIIRFNVAFNQNGAYLLNTTDGNKSPRQPAAGQPAVVTPAFLTTGEQPRAGESYRVAYGRMLTADRQFARATANYLWKEMFGLAIVEPVAAFDLAKLNEQATHPELLEALADEVIAKNYSLREVLRTIALSNTYQLSARYTPAAWNELWVPYFARRYPRRMMAETLFDAVATATNVPGNFNVQGMAPVTKAMHLPDPYEGGRRTPASLFINNFGRGNRDDVSRTNDSAISQALAMMNDTTVTTRVKRATRGSTIERVLASTTDPGSIADQLYLATLSRKPTAEERQAAIDFLRDGTLAERTEDLQFVLLNTLEFIFQ